MIRQIVIEILRRPNGSARPLAIQCSDDKLHLPGFAWQGTARLLTGGVCNLPPFGDQPKESAPKSERRLDGEVRQIMQREKAA